jgi:hypothetical protein
MALKLQYVVHRVRPLLLREWWLYIHWLPLGGRLAPGRPPHFDLSLDVPQNIYKYIERRYLVDFIINYVLVEMQC